jgi:serine/threonine protein kinase
MQESDSQKPTGAVDAQLRYPLPSGTRVDHYVIKEVLGAGGFGITYLAEHEGLGKLYAIKEYFPHAFSYRHGVSVRPTSASDGTYNWGLERFVTEARALARFKHPAIVDVTSIFEANGTAYIVLAYEEGADLMAWCKNLGRSPTQQELDRIVQPLLSALEEVHRNNMMHRDISPDNLLIRQDGTPVLIDFGSAREQIRGRARALSAIVKHGYSPPEQYTSKPELQGPWTDIYALSATLYRIIGGKLPPDATERFIRDELVPIARLARNAYRPSFLAAIDRGLRMKVEERPQSIVEWREALFRDEPLQGPQGGVAEEPAGVEVPPVGRGSVLPSVRAAAAARSSSDPGRRPSPSALAASARPSLELSPSQRQSSIPKSERPDLSWLDEDTDALPGDEPAENVTSSSRVITFVILGALCGAAAGGLFSIILASAISTDCFADKCIFKYLSVCASIGAIAGGVIGMRLAQAPADGKPPAA